MSKQVQKYKGLLDMIDGGGAGAVGNQFEGGGLFSLLANALGTPYGSEDRMRDAMQAQRPVSRPSTMQAMDTMSSPLRPQGRPEGALGPFGGAGANVSGAAAERGMGLDPFGGSGDFSPANAAPVQPSAPGYTQPSSMQAPANNYVPPPATPPQAKPYNDVLTIGQYAESIGYPGNGMSQDQLIQSYVASLGG